MSTFATAIYHYSDDTGKCNQLENTIQEIHTGKEEIKLSLFADDMIVYLETPKESMTKLNETVKEFSKVM